MDPSIGMVGYRLPPGTIRHPWLQALVVIVGMSLFAWVSRWWPSGIWNLAALLAIVTLPATLANTGGGKIIAWFVWLFLAFIALIANEAAAHLVFHTCLYD